MLMKLNIMMNGDEQYPYERSLLCALEIPRCLFLAWVVSQLSMSVAPKISKNLLTFVTVGSLGVVFGAASFAADILKNVFSRLSIHFYNIFRIGDIVKAGSIEGKVVEMGLARTTLLSIDNFLLTVPNSCFLEEVVVNESCVAYKAILTKIPLQSEDLSKIALILKDIAGMLASSATVLLKYDLPYCYVSRIGSSFVELTMGYNLRNTTMAEICTAEQDILLQAVEIIKKHDVALVKKLTLG